MSVGVHLLQSLFFAQGSTCVVCGWPFFFVLFFDSCQKKSCSNIFGQVFRASKLCIMYFVLSPDSHRPSWFQKSSLFPFFPCGTLRQNSPPVVLFPYPTLRTSHKSNPIQSEPNHHRIPRAVMINLTLPNASIALCHSFRDTRNNQCSGSLGGGLRISRRHRQHKYLPWHQKVCLKETHKRAHCGSTPVQSAGWRTKSIQEPPPPLPTHCLARGSSKEESHSYQFPQDITLWGRHSPRVTSSSTSLGEDYLS